MEYFFRFAYPTALYVLVPAVLAIVLIRHFFQRRTVYAYSLASTLAAKGQTSHHPFKKIFFVMRLAVLSLLVLLIAKPQLVDSQSNVLVEGIDIALVLDASGSMEMHDYHNDPRSRFDVAKEEAVRFIKKRDNDAIALVLFGKHAVSRCPLTLDKTILTSIVTDIELGDVNPEGTALCTAMVNGANRLKNSKAKSKIMILLTDGEPSRGDTKPEVAVELAKQLGLKVYTVGIGSDKRERIRHPFYGVIEKPRINKPLLTHIARETGGKFFHAQNAQDMRDIYDTIDALEKTEIETPIYSKYHDIFMPFLLMAIGLMAAEALLSTFFWFGI